MPGDTARENGKNGGRPRGSVATRTLQTQLIRTRLTQRFFEKADKVFDAWEDLALGHFYEVTHPLTGKVKIYKKAPNGMAIKDMVEQVVGKPKQPLELLQAEEQDFAAEALDRMAIYVDPNDQEYRGIIEATRSRERGARAIEYDVRAVGQGLAPSTERTAEILDTLNAEEQA